MDLGVVQRLLDAEPVLADIAARYLGAFVTQTGQNAGCNRVAALDAPD